MTAAGWSQGMLWKKKASDNTLSPSPWAAVFKSVLWELAAFGQMLNYEKTDDKNDHKDGIIFA